MSDSSKVEREERRELKSLFLLVRETAIMLLGQKRGKVGFAKVFAGSLC